jgi:hypothetical protein
MAQAVRSTRVLQQLNVTADELLHVLSLVSLWAWTREV